MPGVALTFDDGPQPETTDRVLDLLAAADVRATFFCVGKNALAHPDWSSNMPVNRSTDPPTSRRVDVGTSRLQTGVVKMPRRTTTASIFGGATTVPGGQTSGVKRSTCSVGIAPAVPEVCPAADRVDLGMGGKQAQLVLEVAGRPHVVGVQERHRRRSGGLDAQIPGCADAPVGMPGMFEIANLFRRLLSSTLGLIGGGRLRAVVLTLTGERRPGRRRRRADSWRSLCAWVCSVPGVTSDQV